MREVKGIIEHRLYEQGVNIYGTISQEEASRLIAERVEQMQKLFSEVMLIAEDCNIRVDFDLEHPKGMVTGHNSWAQPTIHWNPSSQYCGND